MNEKDRLVTFDLDHLGLFTIGLLLHDLGNIEDEALDPLWDRLRDEIIRRAGDQWDTYIDDAAMNGVAYMSDLMSTWIREDDAMLAELNEVNTR